MCHLRWKGSVIIILFLPQTSGVCVYIHWLILNKDFHVFTRRVASHSTEINVTRVEIEDVDPWGEFLLPHSHVSKTGEGNQGRPLVWRKRLGWVQQGWHQRENWRQQLCSSRQDKRGRTHAGLVEDGNLQREPHRNVPFHPHSPLVQQPHYVLLRERVDGGPMEGGEGEFESAFYELQGGRD
jgi:hypothetical protein